MNSTALLLSTEAEHLGIIRTPDVKNTSALVARIAAHDWVLSSLLSAGLAKGHKTNPCTALKALQVYCTPILLSGIASLILTKSDYKLLDLHYRKIFQRMMRLHLKATAPALYILSGLLPIAAQIHIHMFTTLHMIATLDPANHLYKIYLEILNTFQVETISWFNDLSSTSNYYNIPNTLCYSINLCPGWS